MHTIDYAAEYNNRARVPEHPAIMAGWTRDAAAYRAVRAGRWKTIRYGASERQQIDFFPGNGDGAIVLFIHGGYWQAFGRSDFSHLAAGLNARGIDVAIPGYDLCPSVSVPDILGQMRLAARALARLGRPLVASGHSAGGHLTACLFATDWQAIDPKLPKDLVRAGYALSGLFDLVPLVRTPINGALAMSEDAARALSPLFWPVPGRGRFDAVVGGDESSEYLRQSRSIAEAWSASGVETRYTQVGSANHFTVIAPLADAQSGMTGRLAELALSS